MDVPKDSNQQPQTFGINGTSRSQHRRRKIQEFNDFISCSLCRGYLINPTTIDSCMHSYCRSCIVRYLEEEKDPRKKEHLKYCPQCIQLGGGKHISFSNLKSDETLRCLVFKLVPGLYQQERERITQFNDVLKADDTPEANPMGELDEEFYSSKEPISLSLEYHPALLSHCNKDETPPVRYLQCPAGVMIHHLKRFLCSKYDIDPENRQVEIEIIYEDEVLPDDFTLMDVGYCYNWMRNGPMRFTYRILIHSSTTQDISEIQANTEANRSTNTNNIDPIKQTLDSADAKNSRKSVHFADQKASVGATSVDSSLPPPMTYTVFKSKAQENRLGAQNNNNNNNTSKASKYTSLEKEFDESLLNDGNGPVRVIIARKPTEGKKTSPKRSHSTEEGSYVVTNDFKSLRSNDIRYSDYTVTSTTNSNNTNKSKLKVVKPVEQPQTNQVSKCDIVVSIPQSQMAGVSANASEDNTTLSQLKTANKKSPTAPNSAKMRNVPKLKIELGSLKTKITIPKPKSADVCMLEPQHKKSKHRKLSVDEFGPTTDKVDLETYVKNIGLKPIEVVTVTEQLEATEKGKYSPDASPMSSSSSTTSSSNGNFVFTSSSEITSSSHKKRKKKHSRESKDSNGKRRKLHAEISSKPADESLKMKVKLTPSHIHKAQKIESRRSNANKLDSSPEHNAVAPLNDTNKDVVSSDVSIVKTEVEYPAHKTNNNNSSINILSLNKALSEESLNISNLMIGQNSPSSSDELPKIMTTIHSSVNLLSKSNEDLTLSPKPLLAKPIAQIKDTKIPSSPPLPPSLFKTTPLTLTTATASTASTANRTSANTVPSFATKPAQKHTVKPTPPIQQQVQHVIKNNSNLGKLQNFAVPNPPRSPKQCALPTSIASAAHKQMGAQLKRSASLDDSQQQKSLTKLQPDKLMRKTLYGPSVVSTAARPNAAHKDIASKKQSIYSSMSNNFAHDAGKRKSQPMHIPSSSINLSKMNEAVSIYSKPRIPTQTALTITTNPKQNATQQLINLLPYPPQNKPALEIVRITSNQVPGSEKMPLPIISPPKNIRAPQPPIPLLKIKKPGQQVAPSSSVKSPPATVSSSVTKTSSPLQKSPPALVNMRNTIPLSATTKVTPAPAAKDSQAKPNDLIKPNGSSLQDKQKASLRDFRPTSKDGSVEILDLSANKAQESQKPSQVQTTIGNSLEAALNKIKQNINSCTATDSLQSNKASVAKSNNEDLQNLHLLSESATNREKIAIKPQQMLFEMTKTQQPSVVRHQNASVRNIPNPSALAFRNQPSLSMLASVASPPSPQQRPASPSNAVSNAVSQAVADTKTTLSPPSLHVASPKSPAATTNQISPRTKKHASIDQVAASLNMRAAAAEAEASAAKAALIEDLALVSSTSAAVESGKRSPATATSANVNTAGDASSTDISSTTAVSSPTEATKIVITADATSTESPKAQPTPSPTPTPTPSPASTTTTAPVPTPAPSPAPAPAPASASTTATSTATAATVPSSSSSPPLMPKTSFKSISSLVASSSSVSSSPVASSV